ncbi:MAG: DUF2336 domain-containing protein [Pseudomonadota bacterium]
MSTGALQPERLIALAKKRSPESRQTLLRALTQVYLSNRAQYDAAVLAQMDALLVRLTQDAAGAQRRALAEQIAMMRGAPHGLVKLLASDAITIAAPLLRRSEILSDDDLIALIAKGGQAHMSAIARRENLSERVASALIRRADQDALIALAENQTARLSAKATLAMTLKAQKNPLLQTPLCARYDLPPQSLTHLYFTVPAALKRDLLKRCDILDPALVERAAAENRRRILNFGAGDAPDTHQNARALLSDALSAGDLDEALLKDLIAARNYPAFVFAFAYYVGVDASTAQTILKDRTFESLAIACRAAGFEQKTFAKIVFSLRREAGDRTRALRILDLYVKAPEEAAERIMRFWRMRTQAADGAALLAAQYEDEEESQTGAFARHAQKTADL